MSRIHILPKQQSKRYKVDYIINTTSHSDDWSQGLSPFFLGPIKLYRPITAMTVENAWQFTKVYPEHVDENGDPTEAYWQWAKKGWADVRPHRYPMGKGAIPLYSLWKNERLGYVEARKRIYMRVYAKAARKSFAWQRLKQLYDEGNRLTLIDFDSYDHIAEGMSYDDVVNNPNRKMGHGFVLAMMLEGLI